MRAEISYLKETREDASSQVSLLKRILQNEDEKLSALLLEKGGLTDAIENRIRGNHRLSKDLRKLTIEYKSMYDKYMNEQGKNANDGTLYVLPDCSVCIDHPEILQSIVNVGTTMLCITRVLIDELELNKSGRDRHMRLRTDKDAPKRAANARKSLRILDTIRQTRQLMYQNDTEAATDDAEANNNDDKYISYGKRLKANGKMVYLLSHDFGEKAKAAANKLGVGSIEEFYEFLDQSL